MVFTETSSNSKIKTAMCLKFYLSEVEYDLEVSLFSSFEFLTAFLISEWLPCVTA